MLSIKEWLERENITYVMGYSCICKGTGTLLYRTYSQTSKICYIIKKCNNTLIIERVSTSVMSAYYNETAQCYIPEG